MSCISDQKKKTQNTTMSSQSSSKSKKNDSFYYDKTGNFKAVSGAVNSVLKDCAVFNKQLEVQKISNINQQKENKESELR